MKTLSGLDATFLYLETPQMPMHVGSLNLYELPPGFRGSFLKRVQAHMAQRLHLAPILHRRLAFMPFDLGHPVWVDAGEVELDWHIRRVEGGPFTPRQAEAIAARLHGEPIDRSRPLWEFHVFERIELTRPGPDGRPRTQRVAGLYSKIHHAALDGKGGTVLANAMLDLTPTPREVPPPDPARRPRGAGELKVGQMIGAVFSNSLAQYAKIVRALPAAASGLGRTVARQSLGGGAASAGRLARLKPRLPVALAPHTPFNAAITAQRSFATTSLPFAECRALAKAVGGSFNDIVLWLCATALREHLTRHASLPRKPLVAAMPVSLREDSNQELNNQASMSLVALGTQISDPLKRLQAIMGSTGKVKQALGQVKGLLPTDYPSLLAPWLVSGVARAALRTYRVRGVAERVPMLANLAISNVPGPQVPLYLAGARMLSFHPLSIITHGLALNITVQTYAGSVDFGLIADPHAVPHLDDLAAALPAALVQARALWPSPADPAPPPMPGKTRAPRVAKATKSPTSAAKTPQLSASSKASTGTVAFTPAAARTAARRRTTPA